MVYREQEKFSMDKFDEAYDYLKFVKRSIISRMSDPKQQEDTKDPYLAVFDHTLAIYA